MKPRKGFKKKKIRKSQRITLKTSAVKGQHGEIVIEPVEKGQIALSFQRIYNGDVHTVYDGKIETYGMPTISLEMTIKIPREIKKFNKWLNNFCEWSYE